MRIECLIVKNEPVCSKGQICFRTCSSTATDHKYGAARATRQRRPANTLASGPLYAVPIGDAIKCRVAAATELDGYVEHCGSNPKWRSRDSVRSCWKGNRRNPEPEGKTYLRRALLSRSFAGQTYWRWRIAEIGIGVKKVLDKTTEVSKFYSHTGRSKAHQC